MFLYRVSGLFALSIAILVALSLSVAFVRSEHVDDHETGDRGMVHHRHGSWSAPRTLVIVGTGFYEWNNLSI